MLHPITWVTWTAVVATAAMLTRNPLYLLLLLGIVGINYLAVSKNRLDAASWRSLLRVAAGLTLFAIPFNAFSVHSGSHVLFRLPARWLLIGGPITLEATIWGACSALSLMTLLLLFATFNLAINQGQILRLTPGFIYEAGLIVSIALTFFPQMLVSAREIHEAQLIRGHRMRHARDLLPFIMALLTTGLERSFQLAESMEARGLGNVRSIPQARDLLYKALTLIGLGGILAGFFALTWAGGSTSAVEFAAWRSLKTAGWLGLTLSAALLVGVFWAQGRRISRTTYRCDHWSWRDGTVLAISLGVAAILGAVRMLAPALLSYYPYQTMLPPFQPWLGAALLALLAPLLAPLLATPSTMPLKEDFPAPDGAA